MSVRQALISVLHLFVVSTFFLVGLIFLILSRLPEMRIQIAQKLTTETQISHQIGLGFLLIACLLLLGFYVLNRGRFLRIRMGSHILQIEPDLITKTVKECFHTHFTHKISLLDVEISGSNIEIGVHLSPLEESAREELIFLAEKHLENILRFRFGYHKPFYLIVKS